eukprot:scaffold570326_cov39-Prasinocladus_malaysianus.AAC.1
MALERLEVSCRASRMSGRMSATCLCRAIPATQARSPRVARTALTTLPSPPLLDLPPDGAEALITAPTKALSGAALGMVVT